MSNQQLQRQAAQQIAATFTSPAYRKQIAATMGVSPDNAVIDRFARVALRAIQEDPKLLDADRNSLFLACQAAATDGLMPDGKQGKLVIFNTKNANGQWINKVQWQRMVGGIRVLAAKHGFDIIAHPVYANDVFRQRFGDNPGIDHEPAQLGKPRGDLIGYYAVATNLTTHKRYFEVMDAADVDGIRERTKSKDRQGNIVGPWKTDPVEMGRKTVVKRLFKSLPIYDADDLQAVIDRDNRDDFEPMGPEAPVSTQEAEPAPAATSTRPRALQAVVDAQEPVDAEFSQEVAPEPAAKPTSPPPADAEPGPGEYF